MITLGVRANNPGNLRPSHQKWRGELSPDPRGYCVFDSPQNGIRALSLNLLAYQRVHHLRTVETVITRWAPPEDHNDTAAYIAAVASDMRIANDAVFDLTYQPTLVGITVAIIKHENANYTYPADIVVQGVTLALAA